MRQENVRVTPEVAKQWLARNEKNLRSAARWHWHWMSKIMTEGRWISEHPDPIVFDSEGKLRNGQHRLLAVIESGATIDMRVWWDVPEDIIENLDTGRTRGLAERCRFTESKAENKAIAMLINALCTIRNGAKSNTRKPTTEQARRCYDEWQEQIELVLPFIAHRRSDSINKAPLFVALCEFHKRHPNQATEFIRALFSEVGGDIQQARVLREELLRAKGIGGAAMSRRIYGWTVLAARYFVMGKPIRCSNREASWDSQIGEPGKEAA